MLAFLYLISVSIVQFSYDYLHRKVFREYSMTITYKLNKEYMLCNGRQKEKVC